MASTEQRTGFRLPWVSASATDAETPAKQADHPTDEATGASDEQETGTMGMTVADDQAMIAATAAFAARDEATPASIADQAAPPPPDAASAPDPALAVVAQAEPVVAQAEPVVAAVADPWTQHGIVPAAPAAAPRPTTNRTPSRFLADLVRAMRSTAEENRASLVDALQAEGKSSVEQIHARSAAEVDGLRRVADEDVAGIKDWSKAEIARIRTETEERIAERKLELELSLEGHAALIEREVEHVQARMAEYEAETDAFFVRLEEIEDPSEFASVAAEMPEPPSLEEASAEARVAALDELIRETTAARVVPDVDPSADLVEAVAEAVVEPAEATSEPAAEAPVAIVEAEVFAAEPAVSEAAAVQTSETEAPEAVEASADAVAEPAVAVAEREISDEPTVTDDSVSDDPRLAALGLTAGAPEPEAADDEPGIDAMSEATIAARLGDASANGRSAPESTTSVVVIGLVSVASVAAFKRTLGKVAGVRSVGVSSGPEGEFVFRTAHDADVVLKDVIPTLPGFGARVVAAGDGVVNVSARDPEAEA